MNRWIWYWENINTNPTFFIINYLHRFSKMKIYFIKWRSVFDWYEWSLWANIPPISRSNTPISILNFTLWITPITIHQICVVTLFIGLMDSIAAELDTNWFQTGAFSACEKRLLSAEAWAPISIYQITVITAFIWLYSYSISANPIAVWSLSKWIICTVPTRVSSKTCFWASGIWTRITSLNAKLQPVSAGKMANALLKFIICTSIEKRLFLAFICTPISIDQILVITDLSNSWIPFPVPTLVSTPRNTLSSHWAIRKLLSQTIYTSIMNIWVFIITIFRSLSI